MRVTTKENVHSPHALGQHEVSLEADVRDSNHHVVVAAQFGNDGFRAHDGVLPQVRTRARRSHPPGDHRYHDPEDPDTNLADAHRQSIGEDEVARAVS